MGLSASQGRLLMLTARQSDLEFQAQQISQKRLILSQQLEKISRDYEEATTNRQMKIALYDNGVGGVNNYEKTYSNLTYASLVSGTLAYGDSNVTGIQKGKNTGNQTETTMQNFRLVTSEGAIVVSSVDEIPNYYSSEDKQRKEVAAKAEGSSGLHINDIIQDETCTGLTIQGNWGTYKASNEGDKKYDAVCVSYNQNGETKYAYIDIKTGNVLNKENQSAKATESTFSQKDQSDNTTKVDYTFDWGDGDGNQKFMITTTTTTTDNDTGIQKEANGKYCATINGVKQVYVVDPGLAVSRTDVHGSTSGPNYLQDCIRNGKYMIQVGSKDNDEKKFLWKDVSWDAISGISDSYYTEDDDAAKAEYDRLQSQIQNEDKKLELELDNIETQRSAVNTEIESVQKVIDDNVQSSFKIFNA